MMDDGRWMMDERGRKAEVGGLKSEVTLAGKTRLLGLAKCVEPDYMFHVRGWELAKMTYCFLKKVLISS